MEFLKPIWNEYSREDFRAQENFLTRDWENFCETEISGCSTELQRSSFRPRLEHRVTREFRIKSIPNFLILCLDDLFCYDDNLLQRTTSSSSRIEGVLKKELAYRLKIEEQLLLHISNTQL